MANGRKDSEEERPGPSFSGAMNKGGLILVVIFVFQWDADMFF